MQKLVDFVKRWWLMLIMGIITVILAFVLMAIPGAGFETVRIILVIDFIATGIIHAVTVWNNRNEIPAWGWDFAAAIITIILGIILIATPGMSEMFTIFVFIFGFVFKGVKIITGSIALKNAGEKGWGWVLALGILSVLVGFLLIANPIVAALSINMLAGIVLMVSGIAMIVLSIRMSKANSVVKKAEKAIEEGEESVRKAVEDAVKNS